jgi:hypothetical protein
VIFASFPRQAPFQNLSLLPSEQLLTLGANFCLTTLVQHTVGVSVAATVCLFYIYTLGCISALWEIRLAQHVRPVITGQPWRHVPSCSQNRSSHAGLVADNSVSVSRLSSPASSSLNGIAKFDEPARYEQNNSSIRGNSRPKI